MHFWLSELRRTVDLIVAGLVLCLSAPTQNPEMWEHREFPWGTAPHHTPGIPYPFAEMPCTASSCNIVFFTGIRAVRL